MLLPLIIIENPRSWNLELPGVNVVGAREYLTNPHFHGLRQAKVFNLCRTYRHQTLGYYVSLLAGARGHRPLPSVATIQDLRQAPLLRILSEEFDDLVQRALRDLRSEAFELSIYFGHNTAKRYDRIAKALFNQFPAPLLRAAFVRQDERWELQSVRPIASGEIPPHHREFVAEMAQRYFERPITVEDTSQRYRYDLAILFDPQELYKPSTRLAIERFSKAARTLGIAPSIIDKDDYGRIAEYDALFIRMTTAVNHFTYRFSRRAAAEGLVVIDDPESILKCGNKVFLAELFARNKIPCPKTLVVHRDSVDEVEREIGFPCVVKQPDSAFSRGVAKATEPQELRRQLSAVLETSELAIVQEYISSPFDWRIGVLGGKALYSCKYHMAKGDWRIMTTSPTGRTRYGKVESVPLAEAPEGAIQVGVRAASLIGDGLYGVDIKQIGKRFLVMEVNDNPTIEDGLEDAELKEGLYLAVMQHFLEALEERGRRQDR